MNIFDRIKLLKFIEPDRKAAERSRREILATAPGLIVFPRLTVRQVLMRILEVGVAGGLVALFLLLITGGVATSPLTPAPFTAISPEALHAEAQAIDIQIKLANLAYRAAQATATGTETLESASRARAIVVSSTTLSVAPTVTAATPANVEPSLSVDAALRALSQ